MQDNTTVLANAFLNMSTDFQQRVPDPSQQGVAQVAKFLFKPMNRKYLNEFMDMFVNVFAGQLVTQREFRNPLKSKRADLETGTTIQEIELDFVEAHPYKDDWGNHVEDVTNLLKIYRPDGQVAYHSVDRWDTYPISINEVELRGAFYAEYGLNQLAAKIMQVPYNSAEYDEYGYYKQIMAEHEYHQGFYKHQCAYPVDDTTGKAFLRALRAYADRLTIPSRLYNAKNATVPTWINPEERGKMVLYIEPDAKASLDVDTLSAVFQLDKAEIQYRIQSIDSIPIPGAFALLTTEDFWVCADYGIYNTDFRNPQTLTTNYYLTVIGMYSASPFVPAILFTTETGTVNNLITEAVTGLTVTPSTANVKQGGQLALVTSIVGTLTPTPATYVIPKSVQVAPDSVTWELNAVDGDDAPVQLDIDTYIDRFGILHVGTTVPVGTVLTATATSTYQPAGDDPETATATLTVIEPV